MDKTKPFGLATFYWDGRCWRLRRKKTRSNKVTCAVAFCTRDRRDGHGLCHVCNNREWRANHPVQRLWHHLKSSAKRRGIEFAITKAELEELVGQTGYRPGFQTGVPHKQRLSVDRIEASMGYVSGNLVVITVSENAGKDNNSWRERSSEAVPF